ncbi:hypothetical protein COLO4_03187 [Corchorus olitorius]|uniref:Uncharacterized protein n=1 Tax=Corchorus olitorius TaxID=93759 RepID=A0A1R3KZD0_9ROSI|nr:hypothetical protein COLO4_03187 [Corchorus olitorius]
MKMRCVCSSRPPTISNPRQFNTESEGTTSNHETGSTEVIGGTYGCRIKIRASHPIHQHRHEDETPTIALPTKVEGLAGTVSLHTQPDHYERVEGGFPCFRVLFSSSSGFIFRVGNR